MSISYKLNERIKELRISNKLTQKEVAEAMKVPLRCYVRWEKEGYKVDPECIYNLCMYYKISGSYILGLTDYRPQDTYNIFNK